MRKTANALLSFKASLALVVSIACLSQAVANVVVSGTRVIYPAQKKEVTIQIQSASNTSSLVQVWLDSGDEQSSPDVSDVPFILSPPLFRLDEGQGQTLRLLYTQEPLPTDRESLFWLNVLDIPPSLPTTSQSPTNKLEFAFRHRLKIFFRPTGLPGDALSAPSQVSWSLRRLDGGKWAIKATNPTPFHINFNSADFVVGKTHYATESEMVPPFSSRTFAIPTLNAKSAGESSIDYAFINDYGGATRGIGVVSTESGAKMASP